MKNKLFAYMRLGIIVLIVVSLGGCGEKRVKTSLDRNPSKLPSQYGVIAFQVVNNTERLSWIIDNWDKVIAIPVDYEGDEDKHPVYELGASSKGLLSSRVFVGAMPPGQYRLAYLYSQRTDGDLIYTMMAPIGESIGTFYVEDDHLTVLGTLIYQPISGRNEDGVNYYTYALTRTLDVMPLDDYVLERYPDFAQSASRDVLTWEPDHYDEIRERMYQRIKEFSLGSEISHFPSTQETVVLARMGQYYHRAADDSISWEQGDANVSVQFGASCACANGYLLGGERGVLLWSKSISGPWSPIEGPGTQNALTWLAQGGDGRVYALGRIDKTLYLYSSAPGPWEWREERKFSGGSSLFSKDLPFAHGFVERNGNVSVLFRDELHNLDVASGEWQKRRAPRVHTFAQQPDGILVGVTGSSWAAVGRQQFSLDDGGKWEALDRRMSPTAGDARGAYPYIINTQDMYMVASKRQGSGRSRRTASKEVYLMQGSPKLNARANEWNVLSQIPEGCSRMLSEMGINNGFWLWCEHGTIMTSQDGGKTWEVSLDMYMDEEDTPEELIQEYSA